MNKLALSVFLPMMLLCSEVSYAGDTNGYAVTIVVKNNGVVNLDTAGPSSSPATCRNSNIDPTKTGIWSFRLNAPGGKEMYAMLLQAQALKKKVGVVGSGLCDVGGDRETVQYMGIAQ